MPKALLHYLWWQSEPAILYAVDAPRGIEVPQGVHARVLGDLHRLAVITHAGHGHARLHHRRCESAVDDVGQRLHVAVAVRKDESKLTLRTGQLLFLEGVDDDGWHRHDALPGLRLRRPNLVEAVRSLMDPEELLGEVHILPPEAAQF
jgi:hypothetical protein